MINTSKATNSFHHHLQGIWPVLDINSGLFEGVGVCSYHFALAHQLEGFVKGHVYVRYNMTHTLLVFNEVHHHLNILFDLYQQSYPASFPS